MKQLLSLIGNCGRRLGRDTSGLALLEFAFGLPVVLVMSLTGAELTNYIITKMRVSQIALQLADNAARMGSGSQLESKKIYESDINDLLTGANLQSGELALLANGYITISSVEPHATTAGRYRIRWQRCKGSQTNLTSTFGSQTDSATVIGAGVTGVGPTGRQVIAPTNGVTMFVEVRYRYQPLVKTSLSPSSEINEIASMMVRDSRNTSDDSTSGASATHPRGINKVAGVAPSLCAGQEQNYLEKR
ncbi:pilus assembly protein [Sphingomonas sp. BT-65]|uniref:TadE/TadG family type IV pilus assembly protein n=1 Tax=Sphingomonas sp. BT-65 TaxID=2989821 RepID=UPI0022364D9E|nr:pilus assembly protein [Sphingomonas sp. BT-65]MCW4460368.1 pilus assembly protein [Sphingomonas sp. BT-65]